MKQAASNPKTHQQNIRTVDQSPSAGLQGMAVMPPDYGMDLIDREFGGVLQAKLIINQPGDEYEREADRIANQVMTSPADQVVGSASLRIQRFMEPSGEQTETVPGSVYQALAAPGKPLEPTVRQEMEKRFNYDFSQVRVHNGSLAEQSARDVQAHAYTVGRDIVFGSSPFTLHTPRGRQVLAHELTHVVQQ